MLGIGYRVYEVKSDLQQASNPGVLQDFSKAGGTLGHFRAASRDTWINTNPESLNLKPLSLNPKS